MEIFKNIPNYKNLYQVSNLGNVKNLRSNLILTKSMVKPYYVVNLIDAIGNVKQFKIHKLVAMAFLNHIPNRYELVVDHINNNPLDNRLENLQLITNRLNCSKDRNRDLPTGVYRRPNGKFRVTTSINGKYKSLGTFSTVEEASNAYQEFIKLI